MRGLMPAVALAITMVLAFQASALAATDTVQMVGNSISTFAFSPKLAKAKLGDSVQWQNTSTATPHTATNDTTDPWTFDTGILSGGATSASFAFTAAGTFTYHCNIHPTIMMGSIGVPMKVSPASGSVGSPFKIQWATTAPPAGLVFDVQKKDPGGTFQPWQTGVTVPFMRFTPTVAGTYQFRADVRNASSGVTSGFSPGKAQFTAH
jgi:plastocyanin